jgi:hypothetical protein
LSDEELGLATTSSAALPAITTPLVCMRHAVFACLFWCLLAAILLIFVCVLCRPFGQS